MLLDPSFLKPCNAQLKLCKLRLETSKGENGADTSATKVYSDSSSDSGYDESSNQGGMIGEHGLKAEVINAEVAN